MQRNVTAAASLAKQYLDIIFANPNFQTLGGIDNLRIITKERPIRAEMKQLVKNWFELERDLEALRKYTNELAEYTSFEDARKSLREALGLADTEQSEQHVTALLSSSTTN